MKEPEVLLESWSPVCNIQAFVEESETCCYLYLRFNPGQENSYIKSCWICNVSKTPDKIEVDAMKEGMAPAMPKEFVGHDKDGIKISKDDLSIVWFEEGDAAALLEKDKLLCVIPGWSDGRNFNGYSRHAVGTAPYAWEMEKAENVLLKRVNKSRDFWNYFETDYWKDVQEMHIRALETFFGKYDKYYAIDGGNFPPKALITGTKNNISFGITAGVSLIPMPQVEQYFQEEADDFRRMEVGFAACAEKQDICIKMYSFMSSIASLPWNEISFLSHGHTIPCDIIEGFQAVWMLDSRLLPQIEAPQYPDFMRDKINLLWIVPVTEQEYEMIKELGTEEILEQLEENIKGIHIFDGKGKL